MDERKPLPSTLSAVKRAGDMRAVPASRALHSSNFSAQCKHILWDTLGAWFSPSLLDRGTWRCVTKTAEVELKSGRA